MAWYILWASLAVIVLLQGYRRYKLGARAEIVGWLVLGIGCAASTLTTQREFHFLVGISTVLISAGLIYLIGLFLRQTPVT